MKQNIKRTALRKYWGHDTFRPLQERIIDDILDHRDLIALMPTGGGKSICFQLPGLLSSGGVIVVSPLIALIEDQIKALVEKGITARGISSNALQAENEQVISDFVSGAVKMIYLAPERLENRSFLEKISYAKVSYVAIDEAHCISEWGYDFRPSYLNIYRLKEIFPHVNFAAFTATATPSVVNDICDKLGFAKPYCVHKSSFVRSNIRYMIIDNPNAFQRISSSLNTLDDGSAIIYTRSRAKAREVAFLFKETEIKADYYHAGRSLEDRKSVQNRWLQGEIKVIVATTAFGMGIDKPDVRYVFHWDIPETIESYFQEAGRAGRDGVVSYAMLFVTRQHIDQLFTPIDHPLYGIQELKKVYYMLFSSWSLQATEGFFHLHFDAFAQRCGISIRQLKSILGFMERRSILRLWYDRVPHIKFISIKSEIQKWVSQKIKGYELLDILQRRFSHAFSAPQRISEVEIALWLGKEVSEINVILKKFHAEKKLIYTTSNSCVKVKISHDQPSPDIFEALSTAFKRSLKLSEKRRRDMYKFIRSNKCRSSWLLKYFGESAPPCGWCDVCLDRNKKKQSKEVEDGLKELLQTEKNIHQIISALPQFSPHQVNQVLYEMLVKKETVRFSNGRYGLDLPDIS